jgi:hypothetical protein
VARSPFPGLHRRGIGVEKGYEVLLACARDASRRGLPLEFVVVGSTTDDARLLATGHAFITGPSESEEATRLIRAQEADIGVPPLHRPGNLVLYPLRDVGGRTPRPSVQT